MLSPSQTSQGESLVRAIGTFGLAAAIINITIGGGIFRLPANVAGSLGAAAPIAYLVCAVAMGLIVLCIADAGSRVSLTGGPYAYVGTAFGAYAGFISGVLLWMLGTFATAAVSTVLASSVGLLVPALAGRTMEIGILVAAFALLVAHQPARRHARRASQLDRHRRQAPAAVDGRHRRSVLRSEREPAGRVDARGRRRRPHVAAADLRLRGHRMRARAERRSARHRAHGAARDRARHARHHRALRGAAGRRAGHPGQRPRPGHRVAACRRRRRLARRLGALAACSSARRSRCSATWAA